MSLAKWERPLIARYGGGKFDRWARRNYGITGYGLLGRLISGESGGDQSAVSNKGARSITQFIPSTRNAFIRQFGIDPWKNQASAIRAAKIHLMKYGGLRGYNPGDASYPSYILGQNVGNVRRELRRTGHLTARNEYTGKGKSTLMRLGGKPGPTAPGGGGRGGAPRSTVSQTKIPGIPLPQAAPIQRAPVGEIPAPSFLAGPTMPKGYPGAPSSVGSQASPAPRPSIDARLAALPSYEFSGLPKGAVPKPGRGGGGGGGAGGPLEYGGNYSGTRRLAKPAFAVGRQMGVPVSSTKRARKYTDSGNISDHWVGNQSAYAIDFDTPGIESRTGYQLARALAKRYGVRFVANSYESGGTVKIGGRSFRIQLLYGSGVGHGDHVHIGFHAL